MTKDETAGFGNEGREIESPLNTRCNILIIVFLFFICLFGLIGIALSSYGCSNGKWYYKTLPGEGRCGQHTRRCHYFMETMCEEYINKGLGESEKLSCPTKWLVIPPVFIFLIIWITTVVHIWCVMFHNPDCWQKGPICIQTTHLVFGIIIIICGVCLIFFAILVKDNCEKIWNLSHKSGTNATISVPYAGWPYPNGNSGNSSNSGPFEDEKSFKDRCNKQQSEFFYKTCIMLGGIFGVLCGLCYIIIWISAMVRKVL